MQRNSGGYCVAPTVDYNSIVMESRMYLIIVLIFICSCRKDYARRIDYMKIFPVVNTINAEPAQIKGWYHSEFQNDLINFTLEFSHYGGGEMCEYYWANYPDQNSIKLYCNKELYRNSDTIKAGQLLNDFFIIQKNETDNFYISFLISEKPNSNIIKTKEFYTFSAQITTSQNEIFIDSCIVKKL